METFPSPSITARRLCSATILALVLTVSACGASKDEARNACLSAAGLDAQNASSEHGPGFTFIEPFDTTLEGHTFFTFHAVPGPSDTDYRFTVGSCHFKDGAADYEITAQHVVTSGADATDDAINWFRETFGPNALAVIYRLRDDPDVSAELASLLRTIAGELKR